MSKEELDADLSDRCFRNCRLSKGRINILPLLRQGWMMMASIRLRLLLAAWAEIGGAPG
jgi:hypothetical protein